MKKGFFCSTLLAACCVSTVFAQYEDNRDTVILRDGKQLIGLAYDFKFTADVTNFKFVSTEDVLYHLTKNQLQKASISGFVYEQKEVYRNTLVFDYEVAAYRLGVIPKEMFLFRSINGPAVKLYIVDEKTFRRRFYQFANWPVVELSKVTGRYADTGEEILISSIQREFKKLNRRLGVPDLNRLLDSVENGIKFLQDYVHALNAHPVVQQKAARPHKFSYANTHSYLMANIGYDFLVTSERDGIGFRTVRDITPSITLGYGKNFLLSSAVPHLSLNPEIRLNGKVSGYWHLTDTLGQSRHQAKVYPYMNFALAGLLSYEIPLPRMQHLFLSGGAQYSWTWMNMKHYAGQKPSSLDLKESVYRPFRLAPHMRIGWSKGHRLILHLGAIHERRVVAVKEQWLSNTSIYLGVRGYLH